MCRGRGRSVAHPTTVTIEDQLVRIDLWDTPGQTFDNYPGHTFDHIDAEAELQRGFTHADVVILCFCIAGPESFENVRSKV